MVRKSIVSLMKSHPFIFIAFSLLQITSILAAVFLYGNFRAQRIVQEEYRGVTSTFEVLYGDGVGMQKIQDSIQKVMTQAEYPVANITVLLDADNRVVAKYRYNAAEVDMGAPLKNNDDILLDSLYAKDNEIAVGDKVTFLNREFTVCGLTLPLNRNTAVKEIRYDALNGTDKAYQLDIQLQNLPTKNTAERFSSYLYETFDGASVFDPAERNYADEYGFDAQLFLSFSVMLLVVFNISFLYQYILMKRKNVFAIYSICGCTKKKAFFLLLSEVACYFLAHTAVALAVWMLFLKNALIEDAVKLGILDMLIPVFIYFGFMLVIFVPKLMKYARQTNMKLLHS